MERKKKKKEETYKESQELLLALWEITDIYYVLHNLCKLLVLHVSNVCFELHLPLQQNVVSIFVITIIIQLSEMIKCTQLYGREFIISSQLREGSNVRTTPLTNAKHTIYLIFKFNPRTMCICGYLNVLFRQERPQPVRQLLKASLQRPGEPTLCGGSFDKRRVTDWWITWLKRENSERKKE